jgi:hypothetical protein
MQTLQNEIFENLSPDCVRVLGYKLVKNTIEEYVSNLSKYLKEAPTDEDISNYVDDLHSIMSDFDIQASDDLEAYQQHHAGNDSEPDYIAREY